LAWTGDGVFDIQIATDLAFTSLVEEATVSGTTYLPSAAFPVSDTTLFYWRFKAHDDQEFDEVYAVNVIGSSAAACGDLNGDGTVSIPDLLVIVNWVFKGGVAPEPLSAGDFNCDGVTNISDAVYFYVWVFKGGPEPCCQ
jgi:hypothetical protein